ncbi:hypothetical protein P3W45_000312 [Vairimorpha bombi]
MRDKNEKIQTLQIMFNEIQICDSKRYSEHLSNFISIGKENKSFDLILHVIYPILLCKKYPIPSKIVLFIKRFVEEITQTREGSLIVLSLFDHLIGLIDSKTTRVRRNSLYLLNMLSSLNSLNEKINTITLEKISERLFDKEKGVRKEAILILRRYQNYDLSESTKISNIFKNLCRYDPSNEVRKLAFENLEANILTYNCIIDRCADINLGIRTLFYRKFLENINIKEIRHDKKVFLLRRVFSEREIDCVDLFVNFCILYYDLPTEFPSLVSDFYHPSIIRKLEKLIKRLLNLFDCDITGNRIIEDPSLGNILFYYMYLTYIEDTKGKDELNLIDLSKFVEFVYEFSKNNEESDKIEKCRILFSILNLYDVFDDVSKKIFFSTVFKLIKNEVSDEILDEVIKLVYKIDKSNGDKIFGSLIHKNIETNPLYSLKICMFILKYSQSVDQMQDAIINEIVLNFQDKGPEFYELIAKCLFYYLIMNQDDKIFKSFVSYKDKCSTFSSLIFDLSLNFKEDKYLTIAKSVMQSSLEQKDVSVIIPGSKLILSKQLDDESMILKYFIFALEFYYSEDDEQIQQYLNVFFHEYFKTDSSVLLDAFCPVYENLEINEKYFVDQILYLIENSEKINGTQLLFYKICVNIYLYYSESKQVKKFIYVLNRINIIGAWNNILTKKILFCCTQLMKKSGLNKKFTEFVNSLMNIDDGEPISQEDLRNVKQDLLIS